MSSKTLIATTAFLAAFALSTTPSYAQRQQRGRSRPPGGGAVTAVPRRVLPSRPIRPSYVVPFRRYGYRPGFDLSFYYGYPYGYSPYGYAYGGWGNPYYGAYGYGYGAPGYVRVAPGRPYGSVRIQDAPRDAQVFVDGYYAGVVDDFDGTFQHLNLEAGPHRLEIRPSGGLAPLTFDVNVRPGDTVTYHANVAP